MGVFSEQVLERQYDDDPFAEDNEISAFEEEDEMDFPPSAPQPPLSAEEAIPPAKAELPASVTETLPKVGDGEEPDSEEADEKQEASNNTTEDEDAKRKAHDEAEAKRKAEWEAKQQQKKAALREKLDQLAAMSDDEVMTAATKRVSADTERLTRRNMKECVSEHIQTMCLEDPAFARRAMNPRKSMIHCIWYINRKAKEFLEQEMKDNGFKPENGIYGGDVPDELCYQWAVDYFNDSDAKEDQTEDEKFVPKPYYGKTGKTKKAESKKQDKKKSTKKPAPAADDGQISLLGVAS